MLQHFGTTQWDEPLLTSTQQQAITSLESGQVLYFPELAFTLSPAEQLFLCPDYADPDAKNISYHPAHNKLWGVQHLTDQQHIKLKSMLDRFSRYASLFVQKLFPHYAQHLIVARASFRPVQICGRKTSYRKDDKRLHVDAFPSAPNQGKRILRVFCNINPNGENRVWRVGEPFEQVAKKFLPQIKKPLAITAPMLCFLKITKSYRSLYDHYMLRLHDLMKSDDDYQKNAAQQEVQFTPNSTWIVQTDDVSHAAMQGQHVLEQTFYLPVEAMQDAARSPLRILEKMLGSPLV